MSILSKTATVLPSKSWLAITGAAAITLLSAPAFTERAHAGQCPTDKVVSDGQMNPGHGPKGVDDRVLASIDLLAEHPRLKEHKLRLRRLVVQPGGIVPWHSHGERPAVIYIVSGTIVEHASTCAVAITHRAGDVAPETHATSHWWKNMTNKPVVLLSADILHDKADPKTM